MNPPSPLSFRTRYPNRSSLVGMLAVLIISLFTAGESRAQEDPVTFEYKAKAGFLSAFCPFVTWPKATLPATNSTIVIGVFAGDPAASIIQAALQNKKAQEHPLSVKLLSSSSEVSACHMVFLSRAEKDRVEDVLSRTRGSPVVTVSEVDQFCQRGGIFNFVRRGESFKFELNLEGAKKADLILSPKLSPPVGILIKEAR